MFQLCQGRLPLSPISSRTRLPSVSQYCCDKTTVQVFYLQSTNKHFTTHIRIGIAAIWVKAVSGE